MRRITTIVGIVMVALLSSCSASDRVSAPQPDEPADASVSIALQPDGDANLSLSLARFDPVTTPALAEEVARIAFPGSGSVQVDDDRSFGHTVALRVGSAFERGRPATYRFPGAPLFTAFREGGFSTGDLTVCWPDVPADVRSEDPVMPIDDCLRWWGVEVGDRIPAIDVVMHPDPWRWTVGFVSLLVSVLASWWAIAAARAWKARRWTFPRATVTASVLAAVLGQVALWAGGAAGMTTNLLLSGPGETAGTVAVLVTSLLATAVLTLVMVCLGICIHTLSTWGTLRRLAHAVPPRTDRPIASGAPPRGR